MRSKKALINSISSLLSQLVTIICGFVLPRLILSQFGSSYNGITSSITQFLNCVILLRAGVGGVTRAALYKPLADGDNNQISGIVNATQQFMKKVSAIFSILLLAFAIVYPLMVLDEFDYWFSFSLVIILGISTVAQNYFGITYQMLIQADQRQYMPPATQAIPATAQASHRIIFCFFIWLARFHNILYISNIYHSICDSSRCQPCPRGSAPRRGSGSRSAPAVFWLSAPDDS